MRKIKSLYWKILKHIYAGMAMQGLMTNPVRNIKPKEGLSMGQEIAMISERVADYLVNELKKKE